MTPPTTGPFNERLAALGQAETFSEMKRAMLALAEGGEPEALDALLPRLLQLDNENLLDIVGRAAISRWGESVLSRIDLKDISETEKENALYLCRLEGGDIAQAMLCEALRHPSVSIRHTAARLAGELSHRNPSVFESLEKAATSDEDITVRRAAARSLAAGNNPDAVPVLERVLDHTGDEKVENLLIDLRLRVIERMHPGLIPPRDGAEPDGEQTGPPTTVKPMGRVEYVFHQVADRVREVAAAAWGVLAASLKKEKGGDAISPWRVATLMLALALLAFAGLRYKATLEKVRPHAERTAYFCPVCATYQERILGPDARCQRCGNYIFADQESGDPPLAISFPREETR